MQQLRGTEPPPPCRDPRRIELGYRVGHVRLWVEFRRHGRTLGTLPEKLASTIAASCIALAVTARTELHIVGV